MRVRISYSVELEEVPEEIRRMLTLGSTHLHDIEQEIDELISDIDLGSGHPEFSIEKFDRWRSKLAKVDAMLADNQSILKGYFDAIKKPEEDHVSEG